MMYHTAARLTDNAFLQQNYLDLFNNCYREAETKVSLDELTKLIQNAHPELSTSAIQSVLMQKIRVSAGIIPVVITPNDALVLCALSQRTGEEERGVVLSAFGQVEETDQNLWEGALRETEEELGFTLHQTLVPAKDQAMVQFKHQFGSDEAQTITELAQYAKREIKKISTYCTIVAPIALAQDDMVRLLDSANKDLELFSDIYLVAVKVNYQQKRQFQENDREQILQFVEQVLPRVRGAIQSTLQALFKKFLANPNDEHLLEIVYYLIEVGENKKMVVLPYNQAVNLVRQAKEADAKKVIMHDGQSFCKADFAKNGEILINPALIARITKIQLPSGEGNTLRPTQEYIAAGYIKRLSQLVIELADIGMYYNPYGLSFQALQALFLGDKYHQYTLRSGSFLKRGEVVSHVAAAHTDERIAYDQVSPGTELYQFTRPNGWFGDYYALNEQTSADELGISATVSDAAGIEVPRVKVRLVVVSQAPLAVSLSKAGPVNDFWSIVGKNVTCKGGGSQAYLPLLPAERAQALVVLEPDDPNLRAQVEAVANKNGIPLVSIAELTRRGIRIKAHHVWFDDSQYTSWQNTLDIILFNLKHGTFHAAISGLKRVLEDAQTPENVRSIVGLLHSIILGVVGQDENINLVLPAQVVLDTAWGVLHQARTMLDKVKALALLEALNSRNDIEPALKAKIQLSQAMSLNQLASNDTYDINFNDFDKTGRLNDKKRETAQKSILLLEKINKNHLSQYESIILDLELAFAYQKCRQHDKTLLLLLVIEKDLEHYIDSIGIEATAAVCRDIKLQLLGVRLAIGINLARCARKPENIPDQLKAVNPVQYLLGLATELNSAPPMMVQLLFKRWVGENANDLFIEGWFQNKGAHPNRLGTELIALYRQFIPLNVESICYKLEHNLIDKLDLAYLGFEPPTGISNEDFEKVCRALAQNQSLTHLFLRRFTTSKISNNQQRIIQLFSALNTAQQKGQKLAYLSYSGICMKSPEAFQIVHEFLSHNKTLQVLQPSLSDYRTPGHANAFIAVLKKHPNITTLMTGLLTLPGFGKRLFELRTHPTLRNIYPFPGLMPPVVEVHENNKWLHQLKLSLEQGNKNGSKINALPKKDDQYSSALKRLTETIARLTHNDIKVSATSLLHQVQHLFKNNESKEKLTKILIATHAVLNKEMDVEQYKSLASTMKKPSPGMKILGGIMIGLAVLLAGLSIALGVTGFGVPASVGTAASSAVLLASGIALFGQTSKWQQAAEKIDEVADKARSTFKKE